MSGYLDEDVVQRVNDLGTTPWSGQAFRHTSAGRDPLSGIGARLYGGRWNPRDVCSTLYLAQPLKTCLGELDRLAVSVGVTPAMLLRSPRALHTIEVHDIPILDIREDSALQYVGLSIDDIRDDDWTACQAVGHAAYFLEMGGIIAPSATGEGLVISIFEGRAEPGQLILVQTVPLDEPTYDAGRAT